MKVWNPIIEMEQLSIPYPSEAMKYWNELVPIDERWQNDGPIEVETGAIHARGACQTENFSRENFHGRTCNILGATEAEGW